MSIERELLKECRLMLDNPINGTAGRNLQIRITELLAQPEREPLSDGVLSKEIDIIKKDADFSNVRPWQIYYLARRIEELHGIGVNDE